MSEGSIPGARRGKFLATVLANRMICTDHYLLRLGMERFPPSRPGQFVQLLCRQAEPQVSARAVDWPAGRPPALGQSELKARQAFLRRPFSLAGRKDRPEAVELDIIYRRVGTGTGWLAGVSAGDQISVLGPLGNEFRVSAGKPAAALVGGGVGIPPMIYLARELSSLGKNVTAFNGVRSADALPATLVPGAKVDPSGEAAFCLAEFAACGVPSAVSTDDGSLGAAGMISQVFERWLRRQDAPQRDLVVYSCGPEPMMQAVGELCVAAGVECQLAMERLMACGMGTCQSCVVKVRQANRTDWSFKLCCTDGPVFDAREIVW